MEAPKTARKGFLWKQSTTLLDRKIPIPRQVFLLLNLSSRPDNGEFVNLPTVAESKVKTWIVAGKVIASIVQTRKLFLAASIDSHSCAQCIPIGLGSAQLETDPRLWALAAVLQQHWFSIHWHGNNIDLAVIVEITRTAAAKRLPAY
jgi:hypothetical protein